MHRYTKSLALWEQSNRLISPASSIIAKDPRLYTYSAYPIYLSTAQGSIVKDVDGNTYIDYQSGLGPIILGHNYPAVTRAIKEQLAKGTLFSLLHPMQIELAEIICSLVPGAETIRLFKTGADTTIGAVRLARAYTGKKHIFTCHFHGWADWYYVTENMNRGILPELSEFVHPFAYNNLEALKELFTQYAGEIAAVIMEPCQFEKPREDYLQQVKELVHQNNALLIFDEVVTGFRFSLGGGQAYFGVTPDLTCFSKALANGMPLGVVAGKKEIMRATEDVITSTTFSEETLSLAAAVATLKEIQRKPVLAHIWKLGELFQCEFNSLATKYSLPLSCLGFPPRLVLSFADYKAASRLQMKAYFLQETAKRGILFGNTIFMNYSHTLTQVKQTLAVCEEVMRDMQQAENLPVLLEGEESIELW